MSLWELVQNAKHAQQEIIKRIDKAYPIVQQEVNEFMGIELCRASPSINGNIISFYNSSNYREENRRQREEKKNQPYLEVVVGDDQFYQINYLDFCYPQADFQELVDDICFKTGRQLSQRGINTVLNSLKSILSKQQSCSERSTKVNTSRICAKTRDEKRVIAVQCSKAKVNRQNKENFDIGKPKIKFEKTNVMDRRGDRLNDIQYKLQTKRFNNA